MHDKEKHKYKKESRPSITKRDSRGTDACYADYC